MVATKQFIEDAIEGGWDDTNYAFGSTRPNESMAHVDGWEYDEKVFLDPKAWQAVGKTRGWAMPYKDMPGRWEYEAGKFFGNLMADGLSIEETLTKI